MVASCFAHLRCQDDAATGVKSTANRCDGGGLDDAAGVEQSRPWPPTGRIRCRRGVSRGSPGRGFRPACHRLRARRSACRRGGRSEEHTSELQSLMRISYAVSCLKKNKQKHKKEVKIKFSAKKT